MKEINPKDNDIERLKAYHNIEPYLDDIGKKTVLNLLKINDENLEKRLSGKNKEIEFILIMYGLGACEDIVSFDESSSQLTGTNTPDNLVVLKDGKKILIEIKSTNKDNFSISGGNLDSKIKFAEKLGYKLYFALNIKGMWGLFSSSYMKQKSGKIEIKDFLESELEDMFKTVTWVLPKGLKIKSVYSKSKDKGFSIYYEDYGNLILYEILFNNKRIIKINKRSDEYFSLNFIMEGIQDEMSKQSQKIEKKDDLTIIEEELVEEMNFFDEYRLILSTIKHIISNQEELYDYHLFYKNIVEGSQDIFLTQDHIDFCMKLLKLKGVPIKCKRKNLIYIY